MRNRKPNNNLRNILLTILIAGIAIVLLMNLLPLILGFFGQDPKIFGERKMISVIFLIIILIWFASSFIRRFLAIRNSSHNNTTNTYLSGDAKGCLIWIIVFFFVIALYAYRHEFNDFKQRIISAVIPSYEWIGDEEISLTRYADGHFYISTEAIASGSQGRIANIKFLVDTGASGVAISRKDALNMGLDLSKLTYDQKSYTANGVAYSASIKLDKLIIGKKTFYNVRAHVSSGGLDVSLLGMSVLDDFSDVRFVNDKLILKY